MTKQQIEELELGREAIDVVNSKVRSYNIVHADGMETRATIHRDFSGNLWHFRCVGYTPPASSGRPDGKHYFRGPCAALQGLKQYLFEHELDSER
jgi:hypothetical protein